MFENWEKIDTQGMPFICKGFEFDAVNDWGGLVIMKVTELDLEWEKGYANDINNSENYHCGTNLKRIDEIWYYNSKFIFQYGNLEKLAKSLLNW